MTDEFDYNPVPSLNNLKLKYVSKKKYEALIEVIKELHEALIWLKTDEERIEMHEKIEDRLKEIGVYNV